MSDGIGISTMENMVFNWERASATSESKLTQILTQLVSVLEIQGKGIHKLQANVESLTEQVVALEHRDPDPNMTMDPQLTKFAEAVMGVINHNAEDIAEAVWQEIESKVDDAATQAADYAIDHMDTPEDVVRKGLREIL